MLTADQQLSAIRDLCRHPGAFHWTGRQMAKAITKIIDGEQPIPYVLADEHAPIPFELVHDAAFDGEDEQ